MTKWMADDMENTKQELMRLRDKVHDHSNTLTEHQGRIANLEDKDVDIQQDVADLSLSMRGLDTSILELKYELTPAVNTLQKIYKVILTSLVGGSISLLFYLAQKAL